MRWRNDERVPSLVRFVFVPLLENVDWFWEGRAIRYCWGGEDRSVRVKKLEWTILKRIFFLIQGSGMRTITPRMIYTVDQKGTLVNTPSLMIKNYHPPIRSPRRCIFILGGNTSVWPSKGASPRMLEQKKKGLMLAYIKRSSHSECSYQKRLHAWTSKGVFISYAQTKRGLIPEHQKECSFRMLKPKEA